MSSRIRPLVIVLATVCASAALAMFPPTASPASAHDYADGSTPADGAVLAVIPERFDLTMNDDMLDLNGAGNGFALQIIGPDGLYYGDGCVTVDGPTLSSVAALGAPGVYTMRWQVVSADGHPVSDDYSFTWAPSVAPPESAGSSKAPVCGETTQNPGEPSQSANEGSDASNAEPQPSTSASTTPTGDSPAPALWIGGVVLAVAATIGAALVVTERRRRNPRV